MAMILGCTLHGKCVATDMHYESLNKKCWSCYLCAGRVPLTKRCSISRFFFTLMVLLQILYTKSYVSGEIQRLSSTSLHLCSSSCSYSFSHFEMSKFTFIQIEMGFRSRFMQVKICVCICLAFFSSDLVPTFTPIRRRAFQIVWRDDTFGTARPIFSLWVYIYIFLTRLYSYG